MFLLVHLRWLALATATLCALVVSAWFVVGVARLASSLTANGLSASSLDTAFVDLRPSCAGCASWRMRFATRNQLSSGLELSSVAVSLTAPFLGAALPAAAPAPLTILTIAEPGAALIPVSSAPLAAADSGSPLSAQPPLLELGLAIPIDSARALAQAALALALGQRAAPGSSLDSACGGAALAACASASSTALSSFADLRLSASVTVRATALSPLAIELNLDAAIALTAALSRGGSGGGGSGGGSGAAAAPAPAAPAAATLDVRAAAALISSVLGRQLLSLRLPVDATAPLSSFFGASGGSAADAPGGAAWCLATSLFAASATPGSCTPSSTLALAALRADSVTSVTRASLGVLLCRPAPPAAAAGGMTPAEALAAAAADRAAAFGSAGISIALAPDDAGARLLASLLALRIATGDAAVLGARPPPQSDASLVARLAARFSSLVQGGAALRSWRAPACAAAAAAAAAAGGQTPAASAVTDAAAAATPALFGLAASDSPPLALTLALGLPAASAASVGGLSRSRDGVCLLPLLDLRLAADGAASALALELAMPAADLPAARAALRLLALGQDPAGLSAAMAVELGAGGALAAHARDCWGDAPQQRATPPSLRAVPLEALFPAAAFRCPAGHALLAALPSTSDALTLASADASAGAAAPTAVATVAGAAAALLQRVDAAAHPLARLLTGSFICISAPLAAALSTASVGGGGNTSALLPSSSWLQMAPALRSWASLATAAPASFATAAVAADAAALGMSLCGGCAPGGGGGNASSAAMTAAMGATACASSPLFTPLDAAPLVASYAAAASVPFGLSHARPRSREALYDFPATSAAPPANVSTSDAASAANTSLAGASLRLSLSMPPPPQFAAPGSYSGAAAVPSSLSGGGVPSALTGGSVLPDPRGGGPALLLNLLTGGVLAEAFDDLAWEAGDEGAPAAAPSLANGGSGAGGLCDLMLAEGAPADAATDIEAAAAPCLTAAAGNATAGLGSWPLVTAAPPPAAFASAADAAAAAQTAADGNRGSATFALSFSGRLRQSSLSVLAFAAAGASAASASGGGVGSILTPTLLPTLLLHHPLSAAAPQTSAACSGGGSCGGRSNSTLPSVDLPITAAVRACLWPSTAVTASVNFAGGDMLAFRGRVAITVVDPRALFGTAAAAAAANGSASGAWLSDEEARAWEAAVRRLDDAALALVGAASSAPPNASVQAAPRIALRSAADVLLSGASSFYHAPPLKTALASGLLLGSRWRTSIASASDAVLALQAQCGAAAGSGSASAAVSPAAPPLLLQLVSGLQLSVGLPACPTLAGALGAAVATNAALGVGVGAGASPLVASADWPRTASEDAAATRLNALLAAADAAGVLDVVPPALSALPGVSTALGLLPDSLAGPAWVVDATTRVASPVPSAADTLAAAASALTLSRSAARFAFAPLAMTGSGNSSSPLPRIRPRPVALAPPLPLAIAVVDPTQERGGAGAGAFSALGSLIGGFLISGVAGGWSSLPQATSAAAATGLTDAGGLDAAADAQRPAARACAATWLNSSCGSSSAADAAALPRWARLLWACALLPGGTDALPPDMDAPPAPASTAARLSAPLARARPLPAAVCASVAEDVATLTAASQRAAAASIAPPFSALRRCLLAPPAGASVDAPCVAALAQPPARCLLALASACAEATAPALIALRAALHVEFPNGLVPLPLRARIGDFVAAVVVAPPRLLAPPPLGCCDAAAGGDAAALSTWALAQPLQLVAPSGYAQASTPCGGLNSSGGGSGGSSCNAAPLAPLPAAMLTGRFSSSRGYTFTDYDFALSLAIGTYAPFNAARSDANGGVAPGAADADLTLALRRGGLRGRVDPAARALLLAAIITRTRLLADARGALNGLQFSLPLRLNPAAAVAAWQVALPLPFLALAGGGGDGGGGSLALPSTIVVAAPLLGAPGGALSAPVAAAAAAAASVWGRTRVQALARTHGFARPHLFSFAAAAAAWGAPAAGSGGVSPPPLTGADDGIVSPPASPSSDPFFASPTLGLTLLNALPAPLALLSLCGVALDVVLNISLPAAPSAAPLPLLSIPAANLSLAAADAGGAARPDAWLLVRAVFVPRGVGAGDGSGEGGAGAARAWAADASSPAADRYRAALRAAAGGACLPLSTPAALAGGAVGTAGGALVIPGADAVSLATPPPPFAWADVAGALLRGSDQLRSYLPLAAWTNSSSAGAAGGTATRALPLLLAARAGDLAVSALDSESELRAALRGQAARPAGDGGSPASDWLAPLAIPPWNKLAFFASTAGWVPKPRASLHLALPLRLLFLEIGATAGGGGAAAVSVAAAGSVGNATATSADGGASALLPCEEVEPGYLANLANASALPSGGGSDTTASRARAFALCRAANEAVRVLIAKALVPAFPGASGGSGGGGVSGGGSGWTLGSRARGISLADALAAAAATRSCAAADSADGVWRVSPNATAFVCASALPSLPSVEAYVAPSTAAVAAASGASSSAAAQASLGRAALRRLGAWREAVNAHSSAPAMFHIASGVAIVAPGGVVSVAAAAAEAQPSPPPLPPFFPPPSPSPSSSPLTAANAPPALSRAPPLGILLSPSRALDAGLGHDDALAPPRSTRRTLLALSAAALPIPAAPPSPSPSPSSVPSPTAGAALVVDAAAGSRGACLPLETLTASLARAAASAVAGSMGTQPSAPLDAASIEAACGYSSDAAIPAAAAADPDPSSSTPSTASTATAAAASSSSSPPPLFTVTSLRFSLTPAAGVFVAALIVADIALALAWCVACGCVVCTVKRRRRSGSAASQRAPLSAAAARARASGAAAAEADADERDERAADRVGTLPYPDANERAADGSGDGIGSALALTALESTRKTRLGVARRGVGADRASAAEQSPARAASAARRPCSCSAACALPPLCDAQLELDCGAPCWRACCGSALALWRALASLLVPTRRPLSQQAALAGGGGGGNGGIVMSSYAVESDVVVSLTPSPTLSAPSAPRPGRSVSPSAAAAVAHGAFVSSALMRGIKAAPRSAAASPAARAQLRPQPALQAPISAQGRVG